VDAGQDVADVAAAEIEAVRVDELLAVALAAAEVRLEDRITLAGEDLGGEVEIRGGPAVRPSVRIEQQAVRGLGHAGRRQGEDALELPAVIIPLDHLRFSQKPLRQEEVAGRRQSAALLQPAVNGVVAELAVRRDGRRRQPRPLAAVQGYANQG